MSSDSRGKAGRPAASEDTRAGLSGRPETSLTAAAALAELSGQEIAAKFRSLAPRQRRTVVSAFRRQLLPPGKPGRRRSAEITAAYADWAAGMRGLTLYRKHIRRFDRMSHWQRQVKTRALLDAIRARRRREEERQETAAESPPLRLDLPECPTRFVNQEARD